MRRKKKKQQSKAQRSSVNIDLKAKDMARADAAVTFVVEGPGGRLGTLQIGQGTLGWKRSYGQKYRRIPWAKFFERMQHL
jgi:hypothetical protein